MVNVLRLYSGIGTIITGILIGLFAYMALAHHFISDESNLRKYEILSEKGITTDVQTEVDLNKFNLHVKGIHFVMHEVKYSFIYKGMLYHGYYYIGKNDSLPGDSIKIKFMPEEPSINAADVDNRIREIRTRDDNNKDLWLGLGASAISILLIMWGIRDIKKFHQNEKS